MINLANPELEYTLIGELMYLPGNEDLIRDLSEEDFTARQLKPVIKAMRAICAAGGTCDLVSVTDKLSSDQTAYKAAVYASTTNMGSRNAKGHFAAIKQYTARRNIARIAEQLIESAQDGEQDVLAVCDSAVQKIREAMPLRTNADESVHSVLMDTLDMINEMEAGRARSTKINLADFDRVTGGFFGGELTVIGARPGIGKSAFAQYIAMQFAHQEKTVELFSREMSRNQYGLRIISYGSGVGGTKLRAGGLTDADKDRVCDTVGRYSTLPLHINTTARTIPEILTICHERQQNNGLDLVVVDYLQLVNGTGKSREQEVSAVSRGLKEIALEFNIPVIALSQLSRSVGDKKPGLEHLRESGAIEQDADNIIFLHEEDRENGQSNIQIIIAKARQGQTGYVNAAFIPEKMQFRGVYNG